LPPRPGCSCRGWKLDFPTTSFTAVDPAADDLALIQPNMAYAASYLEARREGYTDTSVLRANQAQLGPEQLAGHLAALNQPERGVRWADTPDGPPVLFAHLWIVTPHEFIGRVSIRYELTEKLLKSGGHIGYEVRPAYRGRGLGHRALQLGMEHLRARGISSFLLTCRDDNVGSIRIIEAAGGVLENVVDHPDVPGKRNCRYWIGRTS
jgi:predicted acetyltransferase